LSLNSSLMEESVPSFFLFDPVSDNMSSSP
jgi:hypothetical protein